MAVRGGQGEIAPRRQREGRQKRVVEKWSLDASPQNIMRVGGDKSDICPLAPETLAPPLNYQEERRNGREERKGWEWKEERVIEGRWVERA
jgi:hypothetical protein